MKIISHIRSLILVAAVAMLFNCVKNRDFDAPKSNCTSNLIANATYAEVKGLYLNETLQIQEDLIIEGYVISSDKAGNFFSVLHFQDSVDNPKEGFRIEIDFRDSHLFYPVGSKIYIKLKGLYLGKSKDVFKIGGVFTSFGNVSVGRLPSTVVNQHVFLSCDEKSVVQPTVISINELSKNLSSTLVQFNSLEIIKEELTETFATERKETKRTLTDCQGNEITLLNSGFSDFQAEILPEGNGMITGVLLREKETYQLVIRTLKDIDFTQDRCEQIDEISSQNIFISELADPNNNLGARFVELYNSASVSLSLNGWKLRRYTNDNTEVSSEIDLSGSSIEGEEAFVISPNTLEFETVYGFAPDLAVDAKGPADSNGDDNLVLVDPFGKVIDVFGVIGEDGTATNHEFEDGRAIRNLEVTKANATYTFGEWIIFNDSGNSGTINEPQNAPEDFSPGIRH